MKNQEIENIIEESVIIKIKDVPKHMVGIDLTWLDKEIRKIKDRLFSKLTEKKGYNKIKLGLNKLKKFRPITKE